jgi:SPFH domain / Band 7 family
MALDPEDPTANRGGTELDAVTKDQLNIGLTGQIRYRVCERNLYAYLFGVKRPIVHVMGYFVSILRERIANFEAPARVNLLPDGISTEGGAAAPDSSIVIGVSINDLRKNLRDLNEVMDRECLSSEARYGITFDASLITGIDPPHEVESALAAINTAHNQVSSDISLAQAEDEGVDIVLQRGGRGGLRHTLVHQDDARADPDLETLRVVQLLERLRVHEEHRVAVLLAARLQSERRPRRLVIASRSPTFQQGAFAILTANPEAGLRDLWEHQNGLRLGPEFLRQWHAGVQLLQRRLRRTCQLAGLGLALVLGN